VEQHWSSFDKQFVSSNPTSPRKVEINFGNFKENPFAKWLPTFYDEVLLLTNNELNWSQKVFPKELNVIPNLIVQTLTSVTPHFRKRIDTYVLSENNPKSVEDLISVFEISDNFARTISAVANSDPSFVEKVKSAALEPYFQYQTDYSNIEKKQLSKEFEKVKPAKGVFAKTINNVDNSVPRLFLLGDKAIERCITFTQGSEGEGLMKTLSDIFVEYIQHLFILLQSLREQAHLDVSSTPQPSDWNYCQGALQLLQIVNKVMSRLGNFDRQLRSHLIQQKGKLIVKSANGDVTVTAHHLRNFPERMKKLISFFSNLEDVAFKLLPTPANLLNSYSTSVHGFVFDALFAFFKDKLESIPNLEVWTTEPQFSPLNLPTFSHAPSSYMTQIGEQLLMLPQRLEPFVNASNEAIALESRNSKNSNKGKESIPDDMEEGFESGVSQEASTSDTGNEDDENKFAFHWISAVGRGTVSLYIQKILEIQSLSDLGTKQLVTDIGYLINVLSVLGVAIDPNLEIVLKYLTAKERMISWEQRIRNQRLLRLFK